MVINMAKRKLENDLRKLLEKVKEIAEYHNVSDTDVDYRKTLSAVSGWYAEAVLTASGMARIIVPESELLACLEEEENGIKNM